MNRNVILLTQFALVYLLTNFLQLWSYRWYASISRMLFTLKYLIWSWIFIFWSWKSHGKSMFGEEGAPCQVQLQPR